MSLLGMLSGAGSGGGINVGSAIAYLELNTDAFNSGLDTAISKLNSTQSGLASSLGAVGSSMKNVGSTLTRSVTLPVVGLGTAAVKTFANFEQGMAEVKAIAGEVADSKDFERIVAIGTDMGLSYKQGANMTETAMNIVAAKAEEMGATTEWTSTQAAEAFKYMAMAGWDVGDMLLGIEPIMDLATASGEDLGTTSDIVTDALTAFGLSAKDTGHFTDILAQAARTSNTTVSKMGESFKYVAPIMGSLGMSADDTAVALGLMANNGIKSGMAGRALKNVLTNLAKGTGETAKAMDILDISLENDNGEVKSLKELFDELRQKFRAGSGDVNKYTQEVSKLDAMYAEGKLTEEEYANAVESLATELYGAEGAEKARLAAMLAGKQGMAGLLAIINATEEDYGKLTTAIEKCDGATQEMADTMRDTTEGKIKLMTSAIDALMRSFGELLAPVVQQVAEYITNLANKFNALDESTKETIVKFAAIAAAIGPILIIVGSLITTISKLITIFSSLSNGIGALTGVLGGLSGTVGIVIAAIAAFAAAVIYLWNTNEEFRNGVIAVWEKVKSTVGAAIESIKEALKALEPVFDWILEIWGTMAVKVLEVLTETFSGAIEFITGILQIIAGVVQVFTEGDWTMLWEGIKNVVSGAFDFLVALVKGWVNVFLAPFKWLYDVLLGHSIIPDICEGMIKWFTEAFDKVVQLLKDFVDKIIQWFKDLFEKIKEWFVKLGEKIKNWFEETVQKTKDFFQRVIDNTIEFFSNVFNKITEFIVETISRLVDFFNEVLSRITEFVTSAIAKIREFFANVIAEVVEKINEIINRVRELLTNLINTVVEFITNIWERIKEFLSNLKNIVSEFIGFLKETVGKVKEFFAEIISTIVEKIQEIISKVKEYLSELVDAIVEKVKEIISKVQEFFSELISNIVEKITEIYNKVKEFFSEVINAISEFISTTWEKVKSFLEDIKNTVVEGIETLIEKTKELFKNIVETIREKLEEVISVAKEKFGAVVEFVSQLIPRMMQAGRDFIASFWNGMNEVFGSLWSWVQDAFNGIVNFVEGIWDRISNIGGMIRDTVGGFFDGSHATGLSYVPYNGYIAQLHEGERVLTKQENREYSEGKHGGGDVYNIYSYEKLDEYNIRRELEKMKRQLDL